MKDTLAQQPSNTLSTESLVAHRQTHTHTDYTLQTYMQVGTGRKTTLANDVHQIASKVSARVLTTHLSSRTSLFPLSIFNYIFIFVVAEWHIQPQFATDPKPERTKIEHPPYPTINSPPPHPPHPQSSPEAYANMFSVMSLPFLCQVNRAFLPQFCWRQDDRLKTDATPEKKRMNKQIYVRGRRVKKKKKEGWECWGRRGRSSRRRTYI